MALYIEIENNNAKNHPIDADNLKLAYPNIDINNLPANFASFQRKEKPVVGVYEVDLGDSYAIENGVWTDVYNIRTMTPAEKIAKQDQVKATLNPPASWVWSETFCNYVAPVDCPSDGNLYDWNETTTSWEVQQ